MEARKQGLSNGTSSYKGSWPHIFTAALRSSVFYLFLLGLSIPFVFPFLWMVLGSGKSYGEIFTFPPSLITIPWHWENYATAFTYQPFARQYWNSVYISVLVTLGVLVISSLAGYAYARIPFRLSNVIFIVILSALMMPTEVTIIPNFVFMQELKMSNTHFPLIIIPIFGGSGVIGTFIMRQFFLGFPSELEDAARIDGLGRWGIFVRIALPLSRPALSAVTIMVFLRTWNSFLEPLVFLSDIDKFTLPISLPLYSTYTQPMWEVQLAATTLSVIPSLLIFFAAQQQVVESFTTTGTKG